MMNPNKTESDTNHHSNSNNNYHSSNLFYQNVDVSRSLSSIIPTPSVDPSFSEMILFPPSSSDPDSSCSDPEESNPSQFQSHQSHHPTTSAAYVSPDPHISTQFYTFNPESHSLMIRCLLENRSATSDEIKSATPRHVLKSWRAVWKDRNEDTAYLTAWKRIQEKLSATSDPSTGNIYLVFKNNSQQFVPHIDQWHHIVSTFHSDTDLKHLGLKETVEKIKQVWTVGAKFYGIPESYIRVCVSSCPVCTGGSSGNDGLGGGRNKRRRFEYTESFDVPAKEVPFRLQELATKHKVVLCIRQKYIRYKPFMAEVKDYACHRAGEPASSKKSSKALKREPYASKRCGCGFRIRAIVPITNYNEKDKSFVYQEEGVAVFKLYAVHSGHEPGPLDGNARIMHRVVGHKGTLLMDQEMFYGVREDAENEGGFGLLGKDDVDLRLSVLQQVQDLKAEVGFIEGKIGKLQRDQLCLLSRELFDVVNKVRSLGEECSKSIELYDKTHVDDVLVVENDLPHWSEHHHERLFGDGKEPELIEDDEDSFGRTLGDVANWDHMRTEFRSHKDLLSETCKSEKWLKCSEFDEKSILNCEDSKLTKPMRHHESIVTDVGLVGVQVDSFYPENSKWYDSPCGLDPSADCDEGGFQRGEIV